MKPRIDQLLPGMYDGDAIASDALAIQRALRLAGFESEIYSDYVHTCDTSQRRARPYQLYVPRSPGDLLVYHYSIQSPVTRFFLSNPVTRLLRYHNITPDKYLRGVNTVLANELRRGRQELPNLKDSVAGALCDSDFNRRELEELGFPHVRTVPIMMDEERLSVKPDRGFLKKFDDGRTNILFVGRIAPNKRQDEIVRAFCAYQRLCDPEARLILAGSWGGVEFYASLVRNLARDLRLRHFEMTGLITHAQLMALYRVATVFFSMSEHEGFCVPVVESMRFDLPVVAWAAAAVPDTLGGAGVLIREKDLPRIAEALHLAATDEALRRRLIERGRRRYEELGFDATRARLTRVLEEFLDATTAKASRP